MEEEKPCMGADHDPEAKLKWSCRLVTHTYTCGESHSSAVMTHHTSSSLVFLGNDTKIKEAVKKSSSSPSSIRKAAPPWPLGSVRLSAPSLLTVKWKVAGHDEDKLLSRLSILRSLSRKLERELIVRLLAPVINSLRCYQPPAAPLTTRTNGPLRRSSTSSSGWAAFSFAGSKLRCGCASPTRCPWQSRWSPSSTSWPSPTRSSPSCGTSSPWGCHPDFPSRSVSAEERETAMSREERWWRGTSLHFSAEIPLYHILNARITFSNLNGCEDGANVRSDGEMGVDGDGQRDTPRIDTPSPGSDSSSVSSSSSSSKTRLHVTTIKTHIAHLFSKC